MQITSDNSGTVSQSDAAYYSPYSKSNTIDAVMENPIYHINEVSFSIPQGILRRGRNISNGASL